jgi:RNA polymerase sigma factor (sigma-70 family)
MRSLLQSLRRRLSGQEAASSDADLLGVYLETRENGAFEQIVHRHGAMVFGVCRRMAANPTDAEDAFQAVWLVLVQKANSIQPPAMLGNWLYGVAVNICRRTRLQHVRRLERERRTATPELCEPPLDDSLTLALDEEVARLPDHFRSVVVACDVEGLPRHLAAGRLGLAEGTVASRLSRARALLAKRLLKRGIGAATAAAGTVALPNHLYACALAAHTANSSLPSAAAQVLAAEISRMMTYTRRLWLLAAFGGVAVVVPTLAVVAALAATPTPVGEGKVTATTPIATPAPTPKPTPQSTKPRVVANPAKDIKIITDRDETIPQFFNRQKVLVASVLEEKIKPQFSAKEPSKLTFVSYPAFNSEMDARTYGTSVKIAPVSKEAEELVQERIKDNKERGALQLVFVIDAKDSELVHLVGYTLRNSVSFFEGQKKEPDDFAPAELGFKPKK